jgi:3-oxoacyl-[acyl-carrier protein] reductase
VTELATRWAEAVPWHLPVKARTWFSVRDDLIRSARRARTPRWESKWSGIYNAGNEDGVKQFVQRGLDEFNHIDILINNMAWSAAQQTFAAMSFDKWQRAIHLGLTRSLFMCRAVLPGMIEQSWGRLIQCIGLEGFVGGDPATSAVYGGLIGLTRGMATQYGKYRITANCIGYGGVDGLDNFPGAYPVSRLNDPLTRCGTGQETSSAAIYLASEDAGYITGQ